MIFYDLIQGGADWHFARVGIPTSSCFHRILTPKTMKLSAQAEDYQNVLLYEWATGLPWIEEVGKWAERGRELEPDAIKAYEFQTNRETANGGFFTTDDGLCGASPDRRVLPDGSGRLVQAKCPTGPNHIGNMLTGAISIDYKPQLQGEMWVAECEYNDIVSYSPELPPRIIEVTRDQDFIEKLEGVMGQFIDRLLARREELNQRFGPFPLPKPKVPPAENFFGVSIEDAERIIASWD